MGNAHEERDRRPPGVSDSPGDLAGMARALAAHYARAGEPSVATWLERESRALATPRSRGEPDAGTAAPPPVLSRRATFVAVPDLGALEAAVLEDGDADEFTRIDRWFGAVSRALRGVGLSLFPPAWPRPWDLAMHPADAERLRRWMLADVRERHAGHPFLELMADMVWQLAGPHTDPGIRPGILVHHLRGPSVSPSCTEASTPRSPA